MSEATEPLLRWIPLLPLGVAVYHGVMVGFVRRAGSGRVSLVLSCGALVASLALTCVAYVELIRQSRESRAVVDWVGTWIGTGVGNERFTAEFAFRLDPLTAVLALFVGGFAVTIHFYAARMLWGDRGAPRFFAGLGFFAFSALLFVLAEDLLLLFLGWQGASLGQALLSGYRYDDHAASRGGSVNAVAQRVSDVGFTLGLFLGFAALAPQGLGTLDVASFATRLSEITGAGAEVGLGELSWPRAEFVAACFVVAAFARTAQGPFLLFWNRGMHGRFESLAFVQASIGSLLGFALLLRLAPLWSVATHVAAFTLWIGAATALVAAVLACLQRDLTRALALLLASQLGFAWAALGAQAPTAAFFHALCMAGVHGLLFLCAGRIQDELGGESDLDRMGGLRIRLWHVHLLFGIGLLALAGAPLTAGFFSRNEVLAAVSAADVAGSAVLVRALFVASFCSAFAALYIYFRVFWGESRREPRFGDPLPELDAWSATPLWSLAAFALFGGILGIPQAYGDLAIVGVEESHSLRNWLETQPALVGEPAASALVYGVAGVSTLVFGLAFLLARRFALAPPALGERFDVTFARLRAGIASGRVGELGTELLVARPARWLSARVFDRIDHFVLDRGLLQALPALLGGFSREIVARAHPGRASFALLCIFVGTGAIVLWTLR
jgi:NADH-quinone oxidoreductase subunit L